MLSLDRLSNPTDEELSRFDLAEVDLACASGLPGAEGLDIPACLAKLDGWADWVRRFTEGTYDQFLQAPEEFDGSEAVFRAMCLATTLQRGAGVRYNPARIADPEEWTDSRDDFIHGILTGQGGTCTSLPFLYVAVGRRLGYPMRLVPTTRHLFARWDDPPGDRFNIECTSIGLTIHPDEYYLTWPRTVTETELREFRFLRSLSPREEVAYAWRKRGYILHANGRSREAVQSFATACSIAMDDRLQDWILYRFLNHWRAEIRAMVPAETPRLEIGLPPRRRYPGLPQEVERDIIALEVVEWLLGKSIPRDAQVVAVRVTH